MSASVFPARAGMSPVIYTAGTSRSGVPRASGDEPMAMARKMQKVLCSPRERG